MTRIYILAFVMSKYFMFAVNAVQVAQLQPKEKNAYSNDINKCFFRTWNHYTKGLGVTKNVMKCEQEPNRVGLCYGLLTNNQWIPSFAVCYDETTLIPVFTGHIVSPHGIVDNVDREFRNEAGSHAPKQGEQSDQDKDYTSVGMFNRGHLTPRSAFGTAKGKQLTMINTNIAPQLPPFNDGNWAKLEQAVLSYSNEKKLDIYVVTGTGGQNLNYFGQPAFQNDRVVVPKYFWKAVCDPNLKSSVVFVGANPTGIESMDVPSKQAGCMLNNKSPAPEMTTRLGIIQCYSLKELKRQPESKFFSLPPFGEKCDPSQRGTFLDSYLKNLI